MVRRFIQLMWATIIVPSVLFAQNHKWSTDIHLGIPYVFASIPSDLTFSRGYALRYSYNKRISIASLVDVGNIKGGQYARPFIGNTAPVYFKSYHTNLRIFSANIQFNLTEIYKLRHYSRRLNSFFIAGGGIIFVDASATRSDGIQKNYQFIFIDPYIGLTFRYYLNPAFDLNFGQTYDIMQTYYLDAIHADKKYDRLILTYLGITYKIGCKRSSQLNEWEDVNLEKRRPKATQKY